MGADQDMSSPPCTLSSPALEMDFSQLQLLAISNFEAEEIPS